MFEFKLQDFLNAVLIGNQPGPPLPSIETTVIIDGSTQNETTCAACNFVVNAFDFLNAAHGTAYSYTDYYTINPDTGSGTDHIVMIESGFMDSPYLNTYVSDHFIYDTQGVNG